MLMPFSDPKTFPAIPLCIAGWIPGLVQRATPIGSERRFVKSGTEVTRRQSHWDHPLYGTRSDVLMIGVTFLGTRPKELQRRRAGEVSQREGPLEGQALRGQRALAPGSVPRPKSRRCAANSVRRNRRSFFDASHPALVNWASKAAHVTRDLARLGVNQGAVICWLRGSTAEPQGLSAGQLVPTGRVRVQVSGCCAVEST